MRVKFTDGPDAVDIPLPDGLTVTAQRNHLIDLPSATAQQLVAAGWEKAPPKKRAAKKAAAPEPKKEAGS